MCYRGNGHTYIWEWCAGKKRGLKKGLKKTIFGRDGLWGDRPSDPFQMALRAALWTIGTSGKALHDCKTTAFNSYRNLVSTEVCTNNNKTVLLSVLLYCPGSTVPGYASSPKDEHTSYISITSAVMVAFRLALFVLYLYMVGSFIYN